MKERRYGLIKYTAEVIEDSPEMMQKVFGKLVPLDVDYDFTNGVFSMKAASEYFDVVEVGKIIPTYNVKFQQVLRKINYQKQIAVYIKFEKQS